MNGPVFPEPDFYVPSDTGGGGKGKMIIAGLLIVIFLAIIAYMLWPSSSTPSPSPSSPPNESPPPTWKPYCTFNASGTNKDNFNVDSENMELFPIDLPESEYKEDFDYAGLGNILTCKVNASTNSPEFAPSGPTALGYTFPNTNISEKLVPEDGKTTKTDSVCTWNPKSNTCDTPICSLGESYNNVLLSDQDKEQGIKQYLSQDELDAFINRLSCPGGYKYGQCSSKTPGAATQCSISGKQNNKINCLGNCSGDTDKFTKEDCEKDSKNEWVYDPSNTQCKYESLDKPPIKISNIQQISSGEYQGKYKMCDNPGESVNLDSMIDTCSNTCYPNPNNDYTPRNINEMPLSWTNKCGFTKITNEIFNTNTYHITPCANSAVLKGNIYYNICSSDQNCSEVKSDIQTNIPSPSSISPPCQGGGDIFDVYNNCSAASCDNIFGRKATTGSTYAQCPGNKTYISGKGKKLSLPLVSDCNPDSNIPFSSSEYYSKFADDCCVNKTCDDEYPNCPTGFSKRSPSPSPGSSGNALSLQDCCVLETCSEYVTSNNKCVEGTTPTTNNSSTYILPTCCNGYIQITITLKETITSLMQLSPTDKDSPLTNVFPSYILKQLLTSKKLTLDSINSDNIKKTADNLYFINNQTTFMELPKNKQTIDGALTQKQDPQRTNILKLGNQNEYKFYILTSQKYDSNSKSVISFNISEAYTTVKNITDKISDSDPNIRKINASLTDCRSIKGVCDIIKSPTANQVLNGDKDNSYCCFKSTCGNVLTQDQKDKLSGKQTSVNVPGGWTACGSGTYFDEDALWSPSSQISYINASNQCCVEGNITAMKPPGTTVGKDTIDSQFGSYVKNPTGTKIPLPASINFQWKDGKFTPTDSSMNNNLKNNYTCAFNASTPEYGVSKHSDGTYYYKLTGCEDGDNKFCKIPNSYKQEETSSDTYDASIYDLTGLMENNKGSYISMYATAQGGSESKHEGDIIANYGGIACTSDPYGIVDLEVCDEPYDYIKFSGCNTYFPEGGEYEFYTRSSDPNDCKALTTSASCIDEEYLHMCNWNTSKKTPVCEPRPFPTYGAEVGKSCGDNLNSETTFSDAFWLKEGFKNQTYKDTSIFKKGDSTRIIQTPSSSPGSAGPPSSSREVSRRTNYCGYKPKSQKTKGDTGQFHSRVVDSTWMCKDKTCKENNNLNIQLPKDLPNLTSFTSYINGDPLIYNWSVNGNKVSNAQKDFYDGDYISKKGSFTLDDYRPLQGLPLTTFNLTDQYACVNKDKPSSRCARPTASPGAKPECSSNCSLTTISDINDLKGINDLNSGDNVNDRIDRFTKIQNIGGGDYNPSQMEYVHNNIKYHNNYATMCGDNKYLSFFDDYQKCTPCRYQRDPYPLTPAAPNTYNEFYTAELNKLNRDEQSYINQHVYPKSSDPSKPVFLSGVISPSSTSSDCSGGQNKATNEISGWDQCTSVKDKDKCNNSFYFWPETDTHFPGTNEYYNCVYNDENKLCQAPKNSQPCKNTDKITGKTNNYCCYTPTSILTSTSTTPSPQSAPSSNFIINETSPNKDDKNKMSNCSVNSSPSKRTKIPIGEYSTHFVPWWSESSATDLKITDVNFTGLSNKLHQLKPNSPPINIPTCDLHKDRCEDKITSGDCNVNASHSWTSPPSQNFNMCSWSTVDGKCTTNPDWRNDQSMCGHPCLSRIDAKPRECKFSDDCEIIDRYNFGAFSGIASSKVTMYCDSDGRNPILYGTAEDSKYEYNAMHKDTAGYCNPGYYLVDVGGVDNKDGSNKSVYKCLSCDELEFYKTDASSSGSIPKNDMVNNFETYINACGTVSQQHQLKKTGSWKVGSDGKCSKGTGNCTAFLWPSSQNSAANPNFLTKGKKYTSQDVLYTQDPIVADQYLQYKIGNNYNDCADADKGNKNMDSPYCKTYVSAMEKILGLTTRNYDTDHKFTGYNGSKTISELGIDFGNCDYNNEPIMANWDSKTTAIPVNPGGMVVLPKYDKGTTDTDQLILAGHLCPQRRYLVGRPSQQKGELISMDDRYWPDTSNHTNSDTGKSKEYTYCKPLIEVGAPCPGRKEGELGCKTDPGRANHSSQKTSDSGNSYNLGAQIPYDQKMGICGLATSSGDPVNYDQQGEYKCLAGKPPGADCNTKNDYECMEFAYKGSFFSEPTAPFNFYGARCSSIVGKGTCDGPGHIYGEPLDDSWNGYVNPTEVCKDATHSGGKWCDHSEAFQY